MTQNVYARVIAGKITEYPVYEIHIKNRSHPKDWYIEVEKTNKPEVSIYQYVKETVALHGKRAVLTYEIMDHGLDYLFSMVYNKNRKQNSLSVTNFGVSENKSVILSSDIFIDSVPVGYEIALSTAIDKYVSQRLIDFAKVNGYDSVVSLVSYKDSSVEEWTNLANKFIIIRDLTWKICINFQSEIISGKRPIPKSMDEFVKLLPQL
jgi:hypothetical protein